MARRMQAVIDAGFPYLVAEIDGRVVGYGYLGAYRPRPAYAWSVENSIYVAPDVQRSGVGRALLSALIEIAHSARLPADDRGDRRQRPARLDRPASGDRLHLQRHRPCRRLQARPLARPGADAARARRRRQHPAQNLGGALRERQRPLALRHAAKSTFDCSSVGG